MSTVAKGRAYEEAAVLILQDLNIYLTRWGSGAHDQGIDLRVRCLPPVQRPMLEPQTAPICREHGAFHSKESP